LLLPQQATAIFSDKVAVKAHLTRLRVNDVHEHELLRIHGELPQVFTICMIKKREKQAPAIFSGKVAVDAPLARLRVNDVHEHECLRISEGDVQLYRFRTGRSRGRGGGGGEDAPSGSDQEEAGGRAWGYLPEVTSRRRGRGFGVTFRK
jgi:hypothetical protein